MSTLITKAREFAVEAHGSQKYGIHPYSVHLDAVAELVEKYGDDARAVAYLHDTVEDTPVELEKITDLFGRRIADCVSILTDQPGDDRKERKRKTYARMAEVSGDLELALIVKAADRLANLRACVADNNKRLLDIYKAEHPGFKEAAYRPGLCDELWHEMDEICTSAQHGDFNYRFYESPDFHSLIRRRHRPGELFHPEIFRDGQWVTGPPSVLDAITGLSDDVWSGPSWYADEISLDQAREYADEHGLDLFAVDTDSPKSETGSAETGHSITMKRFLPAIVLTIIGTLTCPFVGLIRNYLFDTFPGSAVRVMAVVLGALAAAAFLFAVVRIREHRWVRYGGLVVVGFLLWFQAVGFETELASVNIVEKVHIVQYGLLAYLLYRAFKPGNDAAVLVLTLVWTTFAGTLEEGMQWLVETRTGEFRDVLLNALSGLCGLIFSLSIEPMAKLNLRMSPQRWRLMGTSAAILVLALGAFVHLAHLGYVVDDPEIGSFRSFFTQQQLVEVSKRRAETWATDPPKDLSPWQKEDWFLTEAGWHNHHRNDAYALGLYELARQANLILEKYYHPYLDLEHFRKTGNRRFSPDIVTELDAKAKPVDPADYFSPVAEKRIWISPSKPVFVAWILIVAALLWGLPRVLAR